MDPIAQPSNHQDAAFSYKRSNMSRTRVKTDPTTLERHSRMSVPWCLWRLDPSHHGRAGQVPTVVSCLKWDNL